MVTGVLASCTASTESLEAFCVLRHFPFPTCFIIHAVIPVPVIESLEALRV